MATQWGRKETIIWPPRRPIHTYGAVLLALVCTGLFIWCRFTFGNSALERYYTPAYVRSALGSVFSRHDKYRLLYVGTGARAGRIAIEADVIDGQTPSPEGKAIPLSLSPAALSHGLRALYRGPELRYLDAPVHSYLRTAVFEGDSITAIYRDPLLLGLCSFILLLPFSIRKDIARRKVLKYGRRLKGPVMLSPKDFNATLNGTGLGITTDEHNVVLRIPETSEAKHIQVMGDTGAGKTTLLFQMLRQIEDRGESAIVYDPAGEFIQCFYRKGRGDVVLNPMDARCPYWSPSSELRTPAEARTIAASLYQPNSKNKGEFFTETPQKIFARLLLYRPTPHQLADWMANEDEIDKRVEGTPMKAMIAKGAQQQRSGVLGSLGLTADGLLLLPTRQDAKTEWSATQWAEKREGWIFLSGKKSEREAIRPLHSLWIDLLILRLLELPQPGQKRAWFVLDEVASLQRLPQFHTALTEGRKSNNPIIFGYQGKAQVEDTYDKLAEVMLSQPATKFIMKTAEPKAAKWASELIGEVEIERVRETIADGKRAGKSFTLDRQIEPLVMGSEIEGLADLHSFVKLGNYVSRFSFKRMSLPTIAAAFIPRPGTQDAFWLDIPDSAVQLPGDPDDSVVAARSSSQTVTSEKPKKRRVPRPKKSGELVVVAVPIAEPDSEIGPDDIAAQVVPAVRVAALERTPAAVTNSAVANEPTTTSAPGPITPAPTERPLVFRSF